MKVQGPSRKLQSMKAYRGTREGTQYAGFFYRDYWRGRKDGRIAPAAWQSALAIIDADELRHRNEVRNYVQQVTGEAKTHLDHIGKLLDGNQKKMEDLRNERRLLAEGAAETEYRTAMKESLLATVLIICEMLGLTFIAKSTFGQGLLPAMVIAVLLSALVAFGVKLLLSKVSPERKGQIKWIVLLLGLILTAVGLIGFVVLRAETFKSGLMGGDLNLGQISLGNILLMTGLTLGVPLICGVLYESAQERISIAGNSLRLYRERATLMAVGNDWSVTLRKLEEFDARLDPVTNQTIAFRKHKYLRGFHIGGARNPEAAKHFAQINLQTA